MEQRSRAKTSFRIEDISQRVRINIKTQIIKKKIIDNEIF